jgi:hypothetical protein
MMTIVIMMIIIIMIHHPHRIRIIECHLVDIRSQLDVGDDWDGWIPCDDHHQRHRRLLLLLSFRPFRQVDHRHDPSIMTWQLRSQCTRLSMTRPQHHTIGWRCLRTTTTRPQHMMMPRNDDDRSVKTDHRRCVTSSSFHDEQSQTTTQMSETHPRYSPCFHLYFNDIYEVIIPPHHRFPMKKYELVRKRIIK